MKIIELHLKGYERLFLGSINEVIYKPENRMQVILGSNGIGKSSLLYMLSPLPADINADFVEDGFKIIKISLDNSLYILKSGIDGRTKHNFIKDGKELNTGGTKKVQLGLVLEHFNYTPEIHEILIGSKTFTNMPVSERKKWLTNVSNIDYTYAIGLYMRAKQRHRDLVGGLKIQQDKLATDSMNILSITDKKKLIDSQVHLLELHDILLDSKDNVSYVKQDNIIDNINRVNNNLRDNLKKIKTTLSLADIDKELLLNKVKYDNNIKIKNEIEKTLSEHVAKEKSSNLSLSKIEEEILKTNKDISDIEKELPVGITIDNIDMAKNAFYDVKDNVSDLLNTLTDFSSYAMSNEDISKLKSKLDNNKELNARYIDTRKNLIYKKEELEKLRDGKEIECVNCHHKWHLGYDANMYKEIIDRLSKLGLEIEKLNKQIEIDDERVRGYSSRLEIILELKGLFIHNNLIKHVFIDIISASKDLSAIVLIENKLFDYIRYFDKWINITRLKDYLEKLLKEKVICETTMKIEISSVEGKDVLMKNLSDVNTILIECIDYANVLNNDKVLIKNLDILKGTAEGLLKTVRSEGENEIKQLRNDALNELIRMNKGRLSDIDTKLRDSDFYEKTVVRKRAEVEELSKKEQVMKKAVKALSPTEGLIAKSISGFLRKFTEEMNYVINSVWSYSIKVLPAKVSDSIDLDYKFPMLIDGRTEKKDVSFGSSSMKEIVDLAFKIVSMKYLGLTDYPLFLDEFGRTMDSEHRKKAFTIVDTLSDSSFNQIFIISHFESVYNRFNNADLIVLSPDNIDLDEDKIYNESITLK